MALVLVFDEGAFLSDGVFDVGVRGGWARGPGGVVVKGLNPGMESGIHPSV